MKLQQVLSIARKAIDEFHMIEDGDKIAIPGIDDKNAIS